MFLRPTEINDNHNIQFNTQHEIYQIVTKLKKNENGTNGTIIKV